MKLYLHIVDSEFQIEMFSTSELEQFDSDMDNMFIDAKELYTYHTNDVVCVSQEFRDEELEQ